MNNKEAAIDTIRNAEVVVLSTINTEGYPESRALLNLANPKQYPTLAGVVGSTLESAGDGKAITLYLGTNTSSSKVAQVRADERASLYYCVPGSFHGVWISGDMEVVTDQAEKDRYWVDGWEMYYPKGKTDDDFCLLKIKAKRMRLYRNLSVAELRGDGSPNDGSPNDGSQA